MTVAGRLEVTIKINELPKAETVENNWKTFELDCDGQIVSVTVKPKVWNKLEQASREYPMWVGAIAGKMGAKTANGFVLDQPAIQVFEKKAKEPKEPTAEGEAPPPKEEKQTPPTPTPTPTPKVVMARPPKK